MKWGKLATLVTSIIISSIVVFNNSAQLIEGVFIPSINHLFLQGLILSIMVTILYSIKNKKEIYKIF